MNSDGSMQVDFSKFFGESEILAGRDMSVYRALLFFNLPDNIIFKPVKPVKVFSAQVNNNYANTQSAAGMKQIKDLVQQLNQSESSANTRFKT